MIVALLFAVLPDPVLTPGDVVTTVAIEQLCTPGFTSTVRNVPAATKRAVSKDYHDKYPDWPAGPYEVDHRISLELGGSNDRKNLWIEPIADARRKDVVENRLHRQMCKGEISLAEAQHMILAVQF